MDLVYTLCTLVPGGDQDWTWTCQTFTPPWADTGLVLLLVISITAVKLDLWSFNTHICNPGHLNQDHFCSLASKMIS